MINSEICFCKKDMNVFCEAKSWEQQKDCRHYEKSNYTNKCMFFVLDKYRESSAL